MEKVREMNKEIFENNLLQTIKELSGEREVDIDKVKIIIVPINEHGKMLNGADNQMRLIVLGEKNIANRLLSFEDSVSLLSCKSPFVPIWINVSYVDSGTENNIFKLETSVRFRKPSLLRNSETGHPPFKAVY